MTGMEESDMITQAVSVDISALSPLTDRTRTDRSIRKTADSAPDPGGVPVSR